MGISYLVRIVHAVFKLAAVCVRVLRVWARARMCVLFQDREEPSAILVPAEAGDLQAELHLAKGSPLLACLGVRARTSYGSLAARHRE